MIVGVFGSPKALQNMWDWFSNYRRGGGQKWVVNARGYCGATPVECQQEEAKANFQVPPPRSGWQLQVNQRQHPPMLLHGCNNRGYRQHPLNNNNNGWWAKPAPRWWVSRAHGWWDNNSPTRGYSHNKPSPPNEGPTTKTESEAKATRRAIRKEMEERVDAKRNEGKKPNCVRVKVGGGIDGGCEGFWT